MSGVGKHKPSQRPYPGSQVACRMPRIALLDIAGEESRPRYGRGGLARYFLRGCGIASRLVRLSRGLTSTSQISIEARARTSPWGARGRTRVAVVTDQRMEKQSCRRRSIMIVGTSQRYH